MKRLKSWPVWMLMGVVFVALLSVGATRDGGARTQAERIDAITKRIACPTCDGESVYVSRASAAEAIRNQVARDVADGAKTDDQIVAAIAETFDSKVLLVPRSTGLESLVWVLPMAVLVCSVAGLAVAFRKWRRDPVPAKTDDDEGLVESLLARGIDFEDEIGDDEP